MCHGPAEVRFLAQACVRKEDSCRSDGLAVLKRQSKGQRFTSWAKAMESGWHCKILLGS